MEALRFQVIIDAKLDRNADNVLAFGTFEVTNGTAYPDDGLQAFYEDLLLGKSFPLTFITRGLHSIGKLVAVAFFLQRELVLMPRASSLVMAASLTDRLGIAGLAHIDRDLAGFFRFVEAYLPPGLSRKEQQERIGVAVEWIRQYLQEDRFPSTPREPPPPRVLDVGTGGFVVAESVVAVEAAWIELFRRGYLKGIVVTPAVDGRRKALVARKSAVVAFDLPKALAIFNEAEGAMGEPQEWGADELWLRGPKRGTLVPLENLLEVLVRV